jgi:TraX protein
MIAARAELLKWVGLVSMLIDHAWRFLHVDIPGAAWLGRIAFPCFAVAVGLQVPRDRRVFVALRLALVGAAVTPLEYWVSGRWVLSVLVTLSWGLLFAFAVERRRFVLAVALLALSLCAEYGPAGVLLVAGVSLGGEAGLCLALAGSALLVHVGGLPVAVALGAVAGYLLSDGVRFPRLKGFFLAAYCAQWAALVVGVFLTSSPGAFSAGN